MLVTAFAVLSFVFFGSRKTERLRLGNGTEILYLGRTFGTNHINPALTPAQRWAFQLSASPSASAKLLARALNKINASSTNVLHVSTTMHSTDVYWFRRLGPRGELNLSLRFLDSDGKPLGHARPFVHGRTFDHAVPAALIEEPNKVARIEIREGTSGFGVPELDSIATALTVPVGWFVVSGPLAAN